MVDRSCSGTVTIFRVVLAFCALVFVDCGTTVRGSSNEEFDNRIDREPLCLNNGQMLKRLQNYKLNIGGFDLGDEGRSSFEDRGLQLGITGFSRKEKDTDILFKTIPGDRVTKNKKRKLISQPQHQVRACKIYDHGYKRRFDVFPFFVKKLDCIRTGQMKDISSQFKIICQPILERRHVLRLKEGCQPDKDPLDEVWEHSWEDVTTGCDTIFAFT